MSYVKITSDSNLNLIGGELARNSNFIVLNWWRSETKMRSKFMFFKNLYPDGGGAMRWLFLTNPKVYYLRLRN